MPADALAAPPPRPFASVRDLVRPATLYARVALYITGGLVLLLTGIVMVSGISGRDFPLAVGGALGSLLGGGLFFYLPVWLVVSPSMRRVRRALVDGVRQPARIVEVKQLQLGVPRLHYVLELEGAGGAPRRVTIESQRVATLAVGATVDVYVAPRDRRAVAVLLPGEGLLQAF